MVTAVLRESGCERGGRAAILVQYDCNLHFYRDCTLCWCRDAVQQDQRLCTVITLLVLFAHCAVRRVKGCRAKWRANRHMMKRGKQVCRSHSATF